MNYFATRTDNGKLFFVEQRQGMPDHRLGRRAKMAATLNVSNPMGAVNEVRRSCAVGTAVHQNTKVEKVSALQRLANSEDRRGEGGRVR